MPDHASTTSATRTRAIRMAGIGLPASGFETAGGMEERVATVISASCKRSAKVYIAKPIFQTTDVLRPGFYHSRDHPSVHSCIVNPLPVLSFRRFAKRPREPALSEAEGNLLFHCERACGKPCQ